MKTPTDHLSDFIFASVITLVISFAAISSLMAFNTILSNKVLAAARDNTELTGCDKFLKNANKDCSYLFSSPNYSDIAKLLKFKTVEHRAAFWLGFSFSNYLNCSSLAPSFTGSAAPEHIFRKHFLEEVNIGEGALQRKKDEPYALAFFAGEGLYFDLQDSFEERDICEIIHEAVGPRGKIASLLKVIN